MDSIPGSSEDVLKALSNSIRREIMRKIATKGTATYTEMMQVLGLDPSLESGRFNYHLKELSESGLISRKDNEYKITELGKKALILIEQVASESKIDRYGVLSAAIIMNSKEELHLFIYQTVFVIGLLFAIIGFSVLIMENITDFTFYSTTWLLSLIGFLMLSVAGYRLYKIARKYRLGLSALLMLGYDWFLIRSVNRLNFLITTIFLVTGVSIIVSLFMTSLVEEIAVGSFELTIMLFFSMILILLSFITLWRAKVKVDVMEAVEYGRHE